MTGHFLKAPSAGLDVIVEMKYENTFFLICYYALYYRPFSFSIVTLPILKTAVFTAFCSERKTVSPARIPFFLCNVSKRSMRFDRQPRPQINYAVSFLADRLVR